MADSGSVTLRILANASGISSEFARVEKQLKSTGEHAGKAFDKIDNKLSLVPKRLLGIAGALAAVTKVAEVLNAATDKLAASASSTNKRHMDFSSAALRAGGSYGDNMAWINTNGKNEITTREQKSAFLSKLGELNQERTAAGLPQLTAEQLQKAKDIYRAGGELSTGEGGGELIASMRDNYGQPFLGFGRQLAGRRGQAYRGDQDDVGLAAADAYRANNSQTRYALREQMVEGRNTRITDFNVDQTQAQNARGMQLGEEAYRTAHPWGTSIGDAIPYVGPDITKAAGRMADTGGSAANDYGRAVVKELKKGPPLPNLSERSREKTQ